MSMHLFSQIPHADIPRSRFSRAHSIKTTFNEDELIPIYVDEYYPADTFAAYMRSFARLATQKVAVMDNAYLCLQAWAVPNRLLWNNFQKFMGEQENPGDSTDYLVPQVVAPEGGYKIHSLEDYFGWPVFVAGYEASALPLRAYNLIWNENYRDENLQNRVPCPKDDGPDDPVNYKVLKRGKRHDYFTSALPWPQKGPGVELPLGTTAPVVTSPTINNTGNPATPLWWNKQDGTTLTGQSQNLIGVYASASGNKSGTLRYGAGSLTSVANSEVVPANLMADLTEATAATINSLRQAFAVQRLFEKDARGGTRYTELLKAHFGVTSPDARLQRPEFLGSAEFLVNMNPIAQTSATDQVTPQGHLASIGIVNGAFSFSKSFVEHGWIFILMSVRTDLSYQQGLNRMFSRKTRFDYYWPSLAFLGEQEIKMKELVLQGPSVISADGTTPTDETTFGYQERWAEMRYYPNLITGQFRTNSKDSQGNANSLDAYHYAQWFDVSNNPSAGIPLNAEFIESNSPMKRSQAIIDDEYPSFLFDGWIDVKCTRALPLYSVPGLLDHF